MKRYFYCLLSIVVTSCTYRPEGEFYKEIPTNVVDYQVLLNDFPKGDTVRVYGRTQFHYAVDASKGRITGVEVLVDGVVIYSGYTAEESFYIEPSYLNEGFHNLAIQLTVVGATGSLADKMGKENVVLWKSWVLEVDKTLPNAPIVNLDIVEGMARISWVPYTKRNFVQYLLIVKTPQGDEIRKSISDPGTTTWIDSSYVGGNVTTYSIKVQNKVGWSGATTRVSAFNLNLNATFNPEDSLVTVTWTPTPYSGTFEKYVISEQGIENAVITENTVASVKFKPNNVGMKYETYFLFTIHPKSKVAYDGSWSVGIAVKQILGKKIKNRPDAIYYNTDVKKFIGYSEKSGTGWIYKYDAQMVATDSISFNILSYSIPFQGQFAYYPAKPNVMQLDLNSFQTRPAGGNLVAYRICQWSKWN